MHFLNSIFNKIFLQIKRTLFDLLALILFVDKHHFHVKTSYLKIHTFYSWLRSYFIFELFITVLCYLHAAEIGFTSSIIFPDVRLRPKNPLYVLG